MTREEHLKFCKLCRNKKFDKMQGMICGLTDKLADFAEECSSYNEDTELKKTEELNKAEKELLSKVAGSGKRLANYIIDGIFFLIFTFFFGIVLGIGLALISPSSLLYFQHEHIWMNYLLTIVAGLIYYSILEYTTGRTIAKFITKTKVVNEKGEKPDFKTIFIRSLCRFIPFEQFSFFGSDNSGLHDKISKTRVIEI